jgi:hypothetical protein
VTFTDGPWHLVSPDGPAGPFWSLVNPQGRVVVLQIANEGDAHLLATALDLLFACELALALAEKGKAPRPVQIEQWRRTIAKAYGEKDQL